MNKPADAVHLIPHTESGGKSIEELNLEPDVRAKAEQLQASAPGVVFTSGRRNVAQQARAMAGNVAKKREYIAKTYAKSAARDALQQWVDDHPHAVTAAAIATGLEQVMNGLPPKSLLALSRHLVGRAFDVQPHSCPEAAVHALNPQKFLTSEGGLTIWHVQF